MPDADINPKGMGKLVMTEFDEYWKQIVTAIKKAGIWYDVMNYEPLTGIEFLEKYCEKSFCPIAKNLLQNEVELIQRQCDAFAMNFKGE